MHAHYMAEIQGLLCLLDGSLTNPFQLSVVAEGYSAKTESTVSMVRPHQLAENGFKSIFLD